MASAGVLLGSAISTGGLTALVAGIFRKKKVKKSESQEKEQGS